MPTKVVMIGGAADSWTPDRIRSTVPGDTSLRCVAGNVSLDQAKTNAKLIEWAVNNQHVHGKSLTFPKNKIWHVADHNDDDVDILWTELVGASVWTDGGVSWPLHKDEFTAQITNESLPTIVHVPDSDVPSHTVIEIRDFHGCQFHLPLIRGFNATGRTSALSAFSGSDWFAIGEDPATEDIDWNNHSLVGVGLKITNVSSTVPSGKTIFSGGAVLCKLGLSIEATDEQAQGPDNLYFAYWINRYNHNGTRISSVQGLDHVFAFYKASGSPMLVDFDVVKGGNILWDYWYLGRGTNLRIGPAVSDNLANFICTSLRGDQTVVNDDRFKLIESTIGNKAARIELRGSFSGPVNHRIVDAQHVTPERVNIQLAIHNMGDEGSGYPIRPRPGQWVPREHEAESLSTTMFLLQPDRDRSPLAFNDAHWVLGARGEDGFKKWHEITTAGELSGRISEALATSGSPRLTEGAINNRDGIRFYDDSYNDSLWGSTFTGGSRIEVANDKLVNAGNGVPDLAEAIGDFTIDIVWTQFRTTQNYTLIQCQNDLATPTGGFRIYVNTSGKPGFIMGSDSYTWAGSTVASTTKPNHIRWTRNTTTGEWKIKFNGVEESTTKTTGSIAAVDGPLTIGQYRAGGETPAYSQTLNGCIGFVAIDSAILPWRTLNDLNTDAALGRKDSGYRRQRYLWQWGVSGW